MRSELPVIGAGIVSIGAGINKHGWTDKETMSLLASLGLLLAVTLATGKGARTVSAIAWLYFIAVLIRAIPAFHTTSKKKSSKGKKK